MMRFPFTLLCLLAFAANVAAEDIEPITVEFEMLGAAGTVHQVQIVSEPDTGITIRAAGHEGIEGRVETFARWFGEPLLAYHSREVGQVAIVQYNVGGGTGVSCSRYFAFCCTEHGCHVLHEDFAQQHSVSITAPRSNYILASEFRAVPEGFSQLVRLDRPVQTEREEYRTIRYDSFGPVELRFRFERGNEGLATVREIDRNSALALLDFIESGIPTPRDWAVGVLEEQWPQLEEPLTDYLACPHGEQVENLHALRGLLDEILSDGTGT